MKQFLFLLLTISVLSCGGGGDPGESRRGWVDREPGIRAAAAAAALADDDEAGGGGGDAGWSDEGDSDGDDGRGLGRKRRGAWRGRGR